MRRWMLNIIVLVATLQLSAQVYFINVSIENLPDREVYLQQYYKKEYKSIDSISSVAGTFYFSVPEDIPAGMFRILLHHPVEEEVRNKELNFIEFIWNRESFEIYANMNSPDGNVVFSNSLENEVLVNFRQFESTYEKKMNVLVPLINQYPEKDSFYISAATHFKSIQEERDSDIKEILNDHSELFASKLIGSYRSPIISPELTGVEQMTYLRDHFFDNSPITDPALLRAPLYKRKIIEYLRLFVDQSFSFKEQERAFIEAVDIVMANVSRDPELRSFVVEYLLEGFESFGMEQIQTYIVDNYVDESCETDLVEMAVERAIGYRKMAEGQTTEDIFIRSSNNTMVRLSEVDADYVLVLFWATYCDHCAKLLPRLREWYLTEKPENLEIFAISIDTVQSVWEDFLHEYDLPWINSIEPLGWVGKSAIAYNIYATPTMFLLDRKRKILAKPITYRELRREVEKIK